MLTTSQMKTKVCGGIQKYFQYKFLDITSVFHDLYNVGYIFNSSQTAHETIKKICS